MWSQIEVDLGGTLSWSAFIAGLRCTLIKQHRVSAQPMKDVSIWQAEKETQPVIKPADVQFVSSGLITGLRSKEHYHLQLMQQVQIGGNTPASAFICVCECLEILHYLNVATRFWMHDRHVEIRSWTEPRPASFRQDKSPRAGGS